MSQSDNRPEAIDYEKVQQHFDAAAIRHPNSNAVLDSGIEKQVAFANIYRDYFTKRYIMKYLAPQINDSILDFGCGVGRISFLLSPMVKKVEGVDVSEKMIQVANQNINHVENVHFTLLKYKHLPFDSQTIDKVITHWVLQHISDEDCKKYFKEFYYLLKPGGRIYLFEQVKNTNQVAANIHIFRTTEQYRQLIVSAGFSEVVVTPVMRVPSRGMSLWNKIKINNRLLLWMLSALDDLIINRKPRLADYFTYAFVFEKKEKR